MLTLLRTLSNMESIGLRELRPNLASTMVTVESGTPVVITRTNVPKAVMVTVAFYEKAVRDGRVAALASSETIMVAMKT